jgi:hypothetical protein
MAWQTKIGPVDCSLMEYSGCLVSQARTLRGHGAQVRRWPQWRAPLMSWRQQCRYGCPQIPAVEGVHAEEIRVGGRIQACVGS